MKGETHTPEFLAHEGGFDLASRARLRRWIARLEQALGIAAA
ncbi:MAG: hypothetical protein U1F68_00790 [Gammaproteobacteria bacterium]